MRADGRYGRSRRPSARLSSAADAELLDYARVALLVLALHVSERLAARAHHLQEAAARMVVFLVRLEVLGEVVDALGEDGDLHFRRAGIVGLGSIVFDERSFALSGYRHGASFLWGWEGLSPRRAATAGMSSSRVAEWASYTRAGRGREQKSGATERSALTNRSPFCADARPQPKLNTRVGRNAPFSSSPKARMRPLKCAYAAPLRTGASRPRTTTAWPRARLAASPGPMLRPGRSSSAASTGRRCAMTSPVSAASRSSVSDTASASSKEPTRGRLRELA